MPKPNILFIFADQLRYSALACSGNKVVQTPNIDCLAREGVVFDQAFSSCPICSPYRGQVLTGRYAHANYRRHPRCCLSLECQDPESIGQPQQHNIGRYRLDLR